jgi:hypothetical protein
VCDNAKQAASLINKAGSFIVKQLSLPINSETGLHFISSEQV